MRERCWSAIAALALSSALAYGYDAERYVSKCGFSMDVPTGTKGKVSEVLDKDGLCKVDLTVEGVEFHAVTEKASTVTLPELEKWVVKYTGIPSASWKKFDEGKAHVGYKASVGGKNVWAAAARGAAYSCIAFVRAAAGESVADLEQFYKSLDCK